MKSHKSDHAPKPVRSAAPTLEQIQARAYELFEEGGRRNGHEIEDWLRAEQELKERPLPRNVEPFSA